MNIEIPKNTYSVEADPAVAEVVKKCVDELAAKDEVLVDRRSCNEYMREHHPCVDNDAIGYEVCRHFVAAGYHAASSAYLGIIQYFIISKRPVDDCFERRIIG